MSRLPEALGKWIVVNLQFGNAIVLIGSYGDKLRLREDKCLLWRPGQLGELTAADDVQPRLILMHAGQHNMTIAIECIIRQLDLVKEQGL